MKKKYFRSVLVAFTLVYSNLLFSQVFSGLITGRNSTLPLPFVNIGVVGKGVGTVSDENGHYSLVINDSLNGSYIKISCIGYKSSVYSVKDFKAKTQHDIQLTEDVVILNQVIVKPKIFKTKVLGNENNSRSISAGFFTNDLGSELGVIMHIKKAPTFIESASFNIAFNDAGPVKFRLNIYNIKNGIVDSIILKEPIFVEIDKQTRLLTVDLKKYNLSVENDFLISLEWIEGHGSDKINFCAGLMNGNCLYRKTSQDTWIKANPVGVGFNCTVVYEK